MSDLLSALQTAGHSLDILQQAMGVIQNNVANASTPGYVTQTLNLSASTFQPENNLWGGVQADGVQSARSQYAEQSVWNQNELLGAATAQASSLSSLQSVFDVTGKSGIPAALSGLFSAFSAWSASPTDATSQQQVLDVAQSVSQAFQQAASSIGQIESQTNQQIESTVDKINQLSSQIASINQQIRNGGTNDAGLQANLYNDLEQLSNLTSISVQVEGDGTATVLMGGQTPLVIGGTQTELQVQYVGSAGFPPPLFPNASPDVKITTASGQDVTSIITEGQLAGLVQFRNTTLPSVIGNQNQQGSLNQLAQAIADKVNGLLTSGQTASGNYGLPLFTYASARVAASLSVNPNITVSQLAAIQPANGSNAAVANGIASQLAQLANNSSDINGMSFTNFYSSVASDVGAQASNASAAQQTQTDLLAQAQNMRAQISGVSLNDQAAQLVQFQQAYEAQSEMIQVITSTSNYFMQAVQSI
jgi:flagellar hook-associated protein 1